MKTPAMDAGVFVILGRIVSDLSKRSRMLGHKALELKAGDSSLNWPTIARMLNSTPGAVSGSVSKIRRREREARGFPPAASSQEDFESIKGNDDRWDAREYQELLGYAVWENFANVIEEAKISCRIAGSSATEHFLEVREDPLSGSPGSARRNYRLTRLACYLVAMAGDPRKEPIALARMYFAQREVERVRADSALTSIVIDKWADHPAILALEGQKELARQWLESNERLTTVETTQNEQGEILSQTVTTVDRIQRELAPKIQSWERLVNAEGLIELAVAAQTLKFTPPGKEASGRTTFNNYLREIGWLCHQEAGFQGTRPTQKALTRGWMEARRPWLPGPRKHTNQAFLTPVGYERLERLIRA